MVNFSLQCVGRERATLLYMIVKEKRIADLRATASLMR